MLNYIRLLRPADWIKNTFVFAALLFGRQLGNRHAVVLSILAFVAFCLASSAGYVLNDILDRNRDRLHPTKKDRPLASGAVSVRSAGVMVAVLVVSVRRRLLVHPAAGILADRGGLCGPDLGCTRWPSSTGCCWT